MRKLIVFENLSLDGYFVDAHGSMDWAKGGEDAELNAFTAKNAQGGGVLVFGRKTYEMMAAFWPTPMAQKMLPQVAERMSGLPKLVFSKKLKKLAWQNCTLAKGGPVAAIRKLKATPGPGLAILGSGSLVAPLAAAGLIDEFQFVVVPVVLGGGRTLFEGMKKPLGLKLKSTRSFKNGKVYLSYEPA